MFLGARIGDGLRITGDLLQRRGQPQGIAGDPGALPVGGVFPGAGYGHLHQHGGKRGENHHQQSSDEAQRIVAVTPAEEHGEVGQHGNGAGDGRRNGHDEGVAVLDVRQLVGDDPGQLFAGQQPHQPGGDGHRRMLRIAPGGEGVGLIGMHDVDLGHGQPGARRQLAHQRVELRRGSLVHRLGAIHAQYHLVGVPPRPDVHCAGEHQRHDHAALTTDQIAQSHEQRGERRQQECRLEIVHRFASRPRLHVVMQICVRDPSGAREGR